MADFWFIHSFISCVFFLIITPQLNIGAVLNLPANDEHMFQVVKISK